LKHAPRYINFCGCLYADPHNIAILSLPELADHNNYVLIIYIYYTIKYRGEGHFVEIHFHINKTFPGRLEVTVSLACATIGYATVRKFAKIIIIFIGVRNKIL